MYSAYHSSLHESSLIFPEDILLRSYHNQLMQRSSMFTPHHSLLNRKSYFSNGFGETRYSMSSWADRSNTSVNDNKKGKIENSNEKFEGSSNKFVKEARNKENESDRKRACSQSHTPKNMKTGEINQIMGMSIKSMRDQILLEKNKPLKSYNSRTKHLLELESSFNSVTTNIERKQINRSSFNNGKQKTRNVGKFNFDIEEGELQNKSRKEKEKNRENLDSMKMCENIKIVNNVKNSNSCQKRTAKQQAQVFKDRQRQTNETIENVQNKKNEHLCYQQISFKKPIEQIQNVSKNSNSGTPKNLKLNKNESVKLQFEQTKIPINSSLQKSSLLKQGEDEYQDNPQTFLKDDSKGLILAQKSSNKIGTESLEERILELQKINKRQSKFIDSVYQMRRMMTNVDDGCNLKELWRWVKKLPQFQLKSL